MAVESSSYHKLKAETQQHMAALIAAKEAKDATSGSESAGSMAEQITKNGDNVDATVKKFFERLKKWEKEHNKKMKKYDTDSETKLKQNAETKRLISEQYTKLKEWVETLKNDQQCKDAAINTCIEQLVAIGKVNAEKEQQAAQASKVMQEKLEDHKQLKKDVSNLTDSIQSMSTCLETLP
jgi:predicted transcriptional regulator